MIQVKKMDNYSQIQMQFKINLIGDDNKLLEDDVYPVPMYIEGFEMPYLTPDKHQAYYIFWGGCTTLGILSLLKLVRL